MGPNRRTQERERAAARAAAKAKRTEAERKATADAQKIVALWNSRHAGGRAPWFYPTTGAAIAAGVPWLMFSCLAASKSDQCICGRTIGIRAPRRLLNHLLLPAAQRFECAALIRMGERRWPKQNRHTALSMLAVCRAQSV